MAMSIDLNHTLDHLPKVHSFAEAAGVAVRALVHQHQALCAAIYSLADGHGSLTAQ